MRGFSLMIELQSPPEFEFLTPHTSKETGQPQIEVELNFPQQVIDDQQPQPQPPPPPPSVQVMHGRE